MYLILCLKLCEQHKVRKVKQERVLFDWYRSWISNSSFSSIGFRFQIKT